MATSSSDSVFGFTAGVFAVPVGVTSALYFDGAKLPGCNQVILKYVSGSTQVFLIGAPAPDKDGLGGTLSAAQLAGATGYILGSGANGAAPEVFPFYGPARGYLAATGATSLVAFVFTTSPPPY